MPSLDDAARRLRDRFTEPVATTDALYARAATIRRRRAAATVALPLLLVVAAVGVAAFVDNDRGVSLETDRATTPDVVVPTTLPVDPSVTSTTVSVVVTTTTAAPPPTVATVPPPVRPVTTTAPATTTTAPAAVPKQGPSQPTITVADARDPSGSDPPEMVKVGAVARDEDGFITHFVVDYGDGSPTERYDGDRMGCRAGPGGYTAPSQSQLPFNPPPTHSYSSPGDYVVTVTVFTTGCDGADEQRASGSFTWQVP